MILLQWKLLNPNVKQLISLLNCNQLPLCFHTLTQSTHKIISAILIVLRSLLVNLWLAQKCNYLIQDLWKYRSEINRLENLSQQSNSINDTLVNLIISIANISHQLLVELQQNLLWQICSQILNGIHYNEDSIL